MNQEEPKQRLIELLKESKLCSKRFDDQYSDGTISIIADHLLANGVTIRERGEWKDKHCTVCGMTPIDEEPWTSCDITPPKFEWCMDFCPNCGADLRGVKDEFEERNT